MAETKTRYVVHATCLGAQSVSYRVPVDGKLVSKSAFSCGADSISTEFTQQSDLVKIKFVGKVSARARNEQGFEIRNIGYRWTPIVLDGIIALRRPLANDETGPKVKTATPQAAQYR